MKKTIRTGKKVLSVFLSVLMVLSAWVFVAPEAGAADGNKYYVKVYVNIYDGSDGYAGAYTVNTETGKPDNYSWATNDGWYGRINMTGFTVFGEGGDYDAQDVSAELIEAESLGTYYAMSGLSDDNADGDWDSKAIATAEYTFTLDSFPVEIFWMNDENNWDRGNTGFAIRKLTVATSEGGTEHTMWEGLAGSDSETYNYYGSITPTGIHTCFEDYAKNYDMSDYKFYKSITTSSQRAWSDPYSAGDAGTYYLNEYANGGVSATFSEGVESVAYNVDYIDTSSTDTYYINYTNHSKTQKATITGTFNQGYFVSSPVGTVILPGKTVSFELKNISSLGNDGDSAKFNFNYTLENVYASDETNAALATFTQPCYISTWKTSDDSKQISDENGDGNTGFSLYKADNYWAGDNSMTIVNTFQTTEGIIERNSATSGDGTDKATFNYNYYIDTSGKTNWSQTGLRFHVKESQYYTLSFQPADYTSECGTITMGGTFANPNEASITIADIAYSSVTEEFKYNHDQASGFYTYADYYTTGTPMWNVTQSDNNASFYNNSEGWFRFAGNIIKGSGNSAATINFSNMTYRDRQNGSKVYFSGTINVYAFDKAELRKYIQETLLDFAPMSARYDTTAFSAYETALQNAMSVLANQKTTQYAINQALANLKTAVAALQSNDNLINQIDSLTHTQYVDGIGSEIANQTAERYVLIPLGEHTVPQKAEYVGNGTFRDATNKKSNLITNYTVDDTEIDNLNYYYWNIDYSQVNVTIALVDEALENFDSDTYSSTLKTALENAKEQLEAIDQTTTGDNTPTSQEDVDNVIEAATDLLAHIDEGYEHCDYDANDDGENELKTKASTCSEAGYTYYKCNICGKEQKVADLELAEHSWGAGIETTAPTCNDAGVMTYTCSNCGATKTEAISATGHSYVMTDLGDGTHINKCSKCGAVETGAVAEAHNYTYTNNADGTHTATCSVCNATVTEAHIFTNPGLVRPTLVDGVWEDGTYTYTCICGETKTEPAVRADYSELEAAVAELEALKDNENLTDDEKAVINNALADADDLADDLVTSEQGDIDALVKELKDIKADADEAIKNKELGVNKITEATSGVKVQFIDKSGLGTIENIQLGKDDAFKIRVANGNADSTITITDIQGTGIAATDTKTLEPGKSADFDITVPADLQSGIITYTITYTIDGLKDADGNPVEATTKAYLYVKDTAYEPYHYLHETALQGSKLGLNYYVEADYGDFTVKYPSAGEKFNENMLVEKPSAWTYYKYYDYAESCLDPDCTGAPGCDKKCDSHIATYNYYVDTSLVKTWQDAGFRTRFEETSVSSYNEVTLRYLRLAVNQTYLDGISGDDKTFTVTFVPSASGTANSTIQCSSTGDLSIRFFEEEANDILLFGKSGTNNVAYANFSGIIPSGINADGTAPAKFMFAPRLRLKGSLLADECAYMTTHIWLTSYDKGELREAVTNAETAGYNSEYYNAEKYEAYENALAAAKEVLGKAETNQNEVDAATEALNNAIADLSAAENEAKFVLTVTHSIHENADKNSEATDTKYDYYLVNGTVTPALKANVIALDTINKYDDVVTLNVTADEEHTYNYWYIDYSGVQDAIDAADEIINNADDYNEDFINDVTEKKEDLEDILKDKETTTAPASQDDVNDAIEAVTVLTGHTCVAGEAQVENTVDATCKAEGSYDNVTYCTTCGKKLSTETVTVNKLPHTEEIIPVVPATCTGTGLTEGKKCSECGEIIVAQTTTSALGHDFEAVGENAATCLAPGNKAYKKCTACNLYFAADAGTDSTDGKADATSFVIAQLAHSYTGEYKWNNAGEIKYHSQKCVNGCNKYGEEVPCTIETTTVAPTCTVGGTNTHTCIVCNNSYQTYTAANGHTWSEPVLTTAPTADNQGEYTETCGVCGATQITKVDLADYDAFNEAVKALEDLAKTEGLTEEAKTAIENALDKAEELDKNLPADVTTVDGKEIEGGQDKIDALVTELNGVVTDVTGDIADGSALEPDYEAWEEAETAYDALDKTSVKAEIIVEADDLKAEIAGKQADDTLTQATATQKDIDDAAARLNEIITGINNDSLRDPDYSALEEKLTQADNTEDLNKDTQDKIDEIKEALEEIQNRTEPEANYRDDQDEVDALEDQLDEILGSIADGTAKAPDYTEWNAAEGTYNAIDKTNVPEDLVTEATELKATIDALKADDTANAVEDQPTVNDATARLNEIIDEINDILTEKPDFTGYDASHEAYEKLVEQYGDKIKDDVASDVADLDTIVEGVRGDETATKIEDQTTIDDAKTALDAIIEGINDGSLRDPDYSAVEEKLDEANAATDLNKDTQDKIDEIKEALEEIKGKTEPEANAKDDQGKVDALEDQLDEILGSIDDGTAKAPDYTKWDAAESTYDAFTEETLVNVKTEILDEVTGLKNTVADLKNDDTANAVEDQPTVNEATARLNEIITGINDGSMIYVDTSEAYEAIGNAETHGVLLSEEETKKLEDLRTQLEEIANDPTSNAKDDQAAVDSIRDQANAIYNKYTDCAEGNHDWTEWTLTLKPTDTVAGKYERTCNICGTTTFRYVAREDYTDYDTAVERANDMLANDKYTSEAIARIQAALTEAQTLDQNLPKDLFDYDGTTKLLDNNNDVVIKEATDKLNAVLDSIANDTTGTYEKVNYNAYNAAVNAYETLKDTMTAEDKAAVEAIKAEIAEIPADGSKKDYQTQVDKAAADIAAINAKYGDCAEGNHTWGNPVLTTAPTADDQGEYTETCGVCGATQITKVDLADYDEFDKAVKALEELANTEGLTDEAKTAIENALEKAEALDKNLPADVTTVDGKKIEGGQDEIDALVTELNGVVTDVTGDIADGSALKPDYTEWEKAETAYDALNKTNVKAEIIVEADALKAAIAGKQANDTLTQKTATQKDIDDATERLNEIIKGINDGSLKDPDYSKVEDKLDEANAATGLNKETQDEIDAIEKALEEIQKRTEPEANYRDNQSEVNALEDQLDEILGSIADGTAKAPDYTEWDAAEGTYTAIDKTNVPEDLVTEATELKATIDALKADDTANSVEDQPTVNDATARLNEIIDEINGILTEKPDFTGYDASHEAYEKLVEQYGDKIKEDVANDVAALDTIVEDVRGDETATKIEDQPTIDDAKTALDAIITGINDGSLRDPDYSAVEEKLTQADNTADLNKDTQDKIDAIEEALEEIKGKTEPEANAKDDQDEVDALEDQLDEILDSIADGSALKPDYTAWDAAEGTYDALDKTNVKDEIIAEADTLKAEIDALKADDTANAVEDQPTINDATARLNEIIEGIEDGSLLKEKLNYDEYNAQVERYEEYAKDGKLTDDEKNTVLNVIRDIELKVEADNITQAEIDAAANAISDVLDRADDCEAGKHNATIKGKTTAPTCTEDGYTIYSCVCGYTEKKDIVTAEGHAYTSVVTEPTCTEDGYTTHTCTVCGDSYKDTATTATGHKYEKTGITAPSCTEEGYTTYTCKCGDFYKGDFVDATGHSYTAKVIEPTCEDQGYTIYTCSVCGDSYTDDIVPAKGHSYIKSGVTAPSCTEKGYTTYTCSCGDFYKADFTDAKGHTEVTLPAKEATCTATGLTAGVKCSECDTVLVAQEIIPAIRHIDEDGDGKCDHCGTTDIHGGCGCICHRTGWFWRLIYIIVRLIWKVFKIHQFCVCGAAHF